MAVTAEVAQYTDEEMSMILADLGLPVGEAMRQVNAYSVGTFRVGQHTHIHVKLTAGLYRVRLSVH